MSTPCIALPTTQQEAQDGAPERKVPVVCETFRNPSPQPLWGAQGWLAL